MLNSLYSMLMGCNEINDRQRFALAFLFCLFSVFGFGGSEAELNVKEGGNLTVPEAVFKKPSNANQAPLRFPFLEF